MYSFGELAKNITKIANGLRDETFDIIKNHEKYVVELNSEEQLFKKGIDSKGSKLAPYAESTKKAKKRKGQPTDRTTTRDSKEFHELFDINFLGDAFDITSYADYTQFLTARYGDDIFGLTDESLTKLIEAYIIPDLLKYVLRNI